MLAWHSCGLISWMLLNTDAGKATKSESESESESSAESDSVFESESESETVQNRVGGVSFVSARRLSAYPAVSWHCPCCCELRAASCQLLAFSC